MTDSDQLVRGIKATFVSRTVNLVANGLLIVLLSRFLLGPSGYGILFLTLSILAVSQLLADLGIARSAARYVSEFKETDPRQVPHILTSSLRYRLLLIGLVAVTLVASREFVAAILDEPELATLLVVGTGYLAVQSINNFNITVFQGFNAVQYSAVVSIVDHVGRIAFILLFVSLGWGVLGALTGYVVSGAIAATFGLIFLYLRFYRSFDAAETIQDGLQRRILEYSVPLTASRSANIIDRRVDIILIGFFLNPVAVGFYTLAKQISDFVIAPADSVGFALSPSYGEDKANDRLVRAARIYESSLQYVLLLYVPAVVGLILVADPTVRFIFGSDYAEAVPVLQVLSLFVLCKAINSVTQQAIDYLGRARFRAVAKAVTSAGNLLLNIVLIPTIGVVGAAVATVFTFGLYTMTNVYIMHVELPLQYDRLVKIGAGATVISVVMGGIVVAASAHITGLVSLAAVVGLGVAVWGTLATVSGLLDVRETLSLLS
ncbi:flippase [Halosolutus amylolyticus]|uniref:Flippase n=1 Tax=Halosolutus amylolyticus TaxID=2932267 RepID=A0ABD5PMG2_9EURY|nr:flippase [Halosolutus amylolyticus]